MAPTTKRLAVACLLLAVMAALQTSVTARALQRWECPAASGRCVVVMPFKEYQEKTRKTTVGGGVGAGVGKIEVNGQLVNSNEVITKGEKSYIPMGIANEGQCFRLGRGCRLEHCHFPGRGTAAEVCGAKVPGCRVNGVQKCEWQSL